MRNLPLIIAWEVWIGRNKFIFNSQPINGDRICVAIIATYNLLPANKHQGTPKMVIPELIDRSRTWAYFDGTENPQGCGGVPYYILMIISIIK